MKNKLIRNKGDIMKFAGSWKNIRNKDIKNLKKIMSNLRKVSTKELIGHTNLS